MAFTDRFIKLPIKTFDVKHAEMTGEEGELTDSWTKINPFGIVEYRMGAKMEEEGWTAKHDQQHWDGSLAKAAACYALETITFERHFGNDDNCVKLHFDFWPWNKKWWKPVQGGTTEGRIRNMVKAGALIAAEIDRLQNK